MPSDPRQRKTGSRPERTTTLLARIRAGDYAAREELIARYLPALQRMAHGRVPHAVRSQLDTDDLVQTSLHRALSHLHRVEAHGTGAFLAYLRTILLNQVRDEARRAARQRPAGLLPVDVAGTQKTPLQELVGSEVLEVYESALQELQPAEREGVILRIELGMDYEHVAEALGRPTANAARLLVGRALVKLARCMKARGIPG